MPAIALAMLAMASATAAAQSAHSAQPSGPLALVTNMYVEYAAAAVVESPAYRDRDVFESKASMARYLDDELIALVLADQACQKRTGGICNLDFAPIWDSQDPPGTIADISATKDPARVRVDLLFGSDAAATRHLTYVCVKTPAGWRIHDIEYGSHESLLQILRAK